MKLSDEQREIIRNHVSEEIIIDGHASRRSLLTREAPDAVLWILNTVALWICCLRMGNPIIICVGNR